MQAGDLSFPDTVQLTHLHINGAGTLTEFHPIKLNHTWLTEVLQKLTHSFCIEFLVLLSHCMSHVEWRLGAVSTASQWIIFKSTRQALSQLVCQQHTVGWNEWINNMKIIMTNSWLWKKNELNFLFKPNITKHSVVSLPKY
jgi:hypothetical protein